MARPHMDEREPLSAQFGWHRCIQCQDATSTIKARLYHPNGLNGTYQWAWGVFCSDACADAYEVTMEADGSP